MTQGKRLSELGLRAGDKLELAEVLTGESGYIGKHYTLAVDGRLISVENNSQWYGRISDSWLDRFTRWKLVSPKLWKDMTETEQGALLLAYHRKEVIEWPGLRGSVCSTEDGFDPVWDDNVGYRVRPKPPVITLTGNATHGLWGRNPGESDTHRITFNIADGRPDCTSVRMEEL